MTTPAKWKPQPAELDDVVARAQALYTAALDSKPSKGDWPTDALVDAVTVIPELIREMQEVTVLPRLVIADDVPTSRFGPVTILPEPAATTVDQEAVQDVLSAHRLMGAKCRCGLDPRLDYYRYEQHVADAVLALLNGETDE